MLLLSRATNQGLTHLEELDPDTGVTAKQRRLAEILEMILAAQAIHKSVLNLPHDLHQVGCRILGVRSLGQHIFSQCSISTRCHFDNKTQRVCILLDLTWPSSDSETLVLSLTNKPSTFPFINKNCHETQIINCLGPSAIKQFAE
jgi:hypothetical protein